MRRERSMAIARRSVLQGAAAITAAAVFDRRDAKAASDTPASKEVLAFWYGWYGTPAFSGHWHGWRGVDEANHHCDSTTFYPLNGPYDSHDPSAVGQQVALAQSAGITGFIASWWGQASFSDPSLGVLVGQANVATGFKVSAYYEMPASNGTPLTVANVVSDFLYLLRTYASNPCWLTLNDKPTIFIFGPVMERFTLAQWNKIAQQVDAAYAGGVALIAQKTKQVPMSSVPPPFMASHQYTQAPHLSGSTLQEDLAWANQSFGRIVSGQANNAVKTLTIMPGFDRVGQASPFVDRFNGDLYQGLWQAAIAAKPDWLLISTWNEWHEGTQIEPSYEMGNLYTGLTAQFSKQFFAS